MHPTVPRDSNKVFGAPTSLKDDCNDLHVRVEYQEPFGVAIISNWVPSASTWSFIRRSCARARQSS